MKNLARLNIEYLEILPVDLLNLRLQNKEKYNMWRRRHRHCDYHRVDGISPYRRVSRILSRNIGKSFDETFSYYCKQVPKYQQRIFLKEFEPEFRRYGHRNTEYSIDKNGNIVYIPYAWKLNRKDISICSSDYKTELRHKITGHKKEDFESVYEEIEYEHTHTFRGESYTRTYKKYGKFLYYEYGGIKYNLKPSHVRYKAQECDFEPVVVSGWIKYFDSRNNPEFVKYFAEKKKAERKSERKARKTRKQIDYTALIKKNTILGEQTRAEKRRIQQELIKQEEEANLVKIVSHGFDPKTSFRN